MEPHEEKTVEPTTSQPASAPAIPTTAQTAAPTPPAPAPAAHEEVHMPSALQPTDTPFHSLQPSRDPWQLIWKAVSGLHIVLGVIFLVFLALRLMKLGGAEFSAGAVGTPFLILPALLVIDLAALGVFFVLKRPKMSELYKYAIWVGAGFGFVFITGMAYVIVQSI